MKKFKTALLIDDDEDCLFLTKHSLEKLNIFDSVETLTNAHEALDLIRDNYINHASEKCPGVIFVDNHMPVMNGFTFLEKLNSIPGLVKENFEIYMVSSFTNDPDMAKLKKYNVQGFINKPLSLEKLRNLFNQDAPGNGWPAK